MHLGYMHKDALMRNGFLDRYSGRINLDSQLRDWLKMGANMSFNYNKGNDNYKSYGVKRLVQEAIPLIPVKYPDGSWVRPLGNSLVQYVRLAFSGQGSSRLAE